jgi:2-C-methyl-D-erythritol 4-phosphate cytidylyltransferase/2-C-methyl-D-erythritol 2,4-cyclodiphosphate synthase
VFIHDAARPFFTDQMICDMWRTIDSCDGVVPLLPIFDAVKEKTCDDQVRPHPSKSLFRTQTPQLYKRNMLKDAFLKKKDSLNQYRDEAELLEAYDNHLSIKSITGSSLAEKITTAEDWSNLKKILPSTIKTGIGYDFHPYMKDRELVLGGCIIPYHLGLEGDSDGDVLSHSILDSLLGALSLGDIGRYVGIKCSSVLGAKSLGFLQNLLEDSRVRSFKILHMDSTIVCKEPLLNPWIENMVECLCRVLKINSSQFNLKSTTDKGVDGAGEGKGIRVITIATIEIFLRRDEWQTN